MPFSPSQAKHWLKMRDLNGGSLQLSLEEREILESIRTDPKYSKPDAPCPPIPCLGKVDPEAPIKTKPKSRDQELPSQEKSPGGATAIPSPSHERSGAGQ